MKIIELKNKCDLSQVANNKYAESQSNELTVVSDLDFNLPKKSKTKSEDISHFDFSLPLPSYNPEPKLSLEEIKEKRKIIIHIKNYIREFPTSLSEFKEIDYGSKSTDQLYNYLEEIKLTVCQSNSGGMLLGVFQGGCDVLESVAPMINYDLTGLKFVASKNPNIIASVKELSLEYQNLNYIPPEKRLALLMFQMCYALNSMNKTNKKIEDKLEKSLPENINEKYVEL